MERWLTIGVWTFFDVPLHLLLLLFFFVPFFFIIRKLWCFLSISCWPVYFEVSCNETPPCSYTGMYQMLILFSIRTLTAYLSRTFSLLSNKLRQVRQIHYIRILYAFIRAWLARQTEPQILPFLSLSITEFVSERTSSQRSPLPFKTSVRRSGILPRTKRVLPCHLYQSQFCLRQEPVVLEGYIEGKRTFLREAISRNQTMNI